MLQFFNHAGFLYTHVKKEIYLHRFLPHPDKTLLQKLMELIF